MSMQFEHRLDPKYGAVVGREVEVDELRREVARLRPLASEVAVLHVRLYQYTGDKERLAATETELAILKARVDELSKRDPSPDRWIFVGATVTLAAMFLSLAAIFGLIVFRA